jgi:beta-N-acetylhexosaminidase
MSSTSCWTAWATLPRGPGTPTPTAEARRLALLPASPPLAWDDLMHDPAYQHALERLP